MLTTVIALENSAESLFLNSQNDLGRSLLDVQNSVELLSL